MGRSASGDVHSQPGHGALCRGGDHRCGQLSGALAERIAQPRVLGDSPGGSLPGPSLPGALAPQGSDWLFQSEVRTWIDLLARVGLVLIMFLVGLEINPRLIRQRLALASRLSLWGCFCPWWWGWRWRARPSRCWRAP